MKYGQISCYCTQVESCVISIYHDQLRICGNDRNMILRIPMNEVKSGGIE